VLDNRRWCRRSCRQSYREDFQTGARP
jgi:hypothetical protein